ncbi:hypothetical protein A9975_05550 [Cupriavidus sp. UME77]|nr:hypothetical protein [Cupriavidus sp. UME77]
MSVTAASATATLTADEIIVETALGGVRYCLSSFSKPINLATTGAGGMDTGTAPASGYVALYAIYNPTTGATALLAKNATAGLQAEVYAGGNMPAGYTASALIGVIPTNAGSQFVVCCLLDRRVSLSQVLFGTFTSALTNTLVSLATVVPPNAKNATVMFNQQSATAASSYSLGAAGTSNASSGIGSVSFNAGVAGLQQTVNTATFPLVTAQTLYVSWTVTGGSSPQLALYAVDYSF